jgi:hypothetical protein
MHLCLYREVETISLNITLEPLNSSQKPEAALKLMETGDFTGVTIGRRYTIKNLLGHTRGYSIEDFFYTSAWRYLSEVYTFTDPKRQRDVYTVTDGKRLRVDLKAHISSLVGSSRKKRLENFEKLYRCLKPKCVHVEQKHKCLVLIFKSGRQDRMFPEVHPVNLSPFGLYWFYAEGLVAVRAYLRDFPKPYETSAGRNKQHSSCPPDLPSYTPWSKYWFSNAYLCGYSTSSVSTGMLKLISYCPSVTNIDARQSV